MFTRFTSMIHHAVEAVSLKLIDTCTCGLYVAVASMNVDVQRHVNLSIYT